MLEIFNLQKELVKNASTSGYEGKIGRAIADLAKPFCDEMRIDALGNLICHIKGKGKRIMCAAHMDAIGFMARYIDENGFIYVNPLGGHYAYELINTRVCFEKVSGIFRLCKASENAGKTGKEITFNDIYIDIGARSKEGAEKLISIGDTAIFEGETVMLGKNRIMTPYADDLSGCAMLLCAMGICKNSPNDLYFVFTVQEELGCRGAKTAAFGIEPDIAIAVDVCPAGDCPAENDRHNDIALGGGPTIKIMDSSVFSSVGLNKLLKSVATAMNIKTQWEILTGGGTDTSEMLLTRDGVPATCISIPTRNLHMPVEIIDIRDVENGAQLLAATLRSKF